MSIAAREPKAATASAEEPGEQRFVLGHVDWHAYVAISDALKDCGGPRLIFTPGRLQFMTKSHLHEWLAECLGQIVVVVAAYLDFDCEPAGETTFRDESKAAGLEGDRTFYFGPNAVRLRGGKAVDLSVDPPPDLAIEVEVSHAADDAMLAWGRLGTPEVWRFEASTWTCTFWSRQDDGTYAQVSEGRFLRALKPGEIAEQLRLARDLGFSRWFVQLSQWVRDVIAPRSGEGA